MIKVFSEDEINKWSSDILDKVRLKLSTEWSIPNCFFALLIEDNKLKISVVNPPTLSYEETLEYFNCYKKQNSCIALLWTSQNNKSNNPEFFYRLASFYREQEYIQKYNLYPQFKFKNNQLKKEILNSMI